MRRPSPPPAERLARDAGIRSAYGLEPQRRIARRLGLKPGVVARVHADAIAAGLLEPMDEDTKRRMHALGRDLVRGRRRAPAAEMSGRAG